MGLYGLGTAYYHRYGIPLMLTETSIDGQPINREIWLEDTCDHIRRLREEGIPMLGFIWWPFLDQIDWDGALTHRVGKIHRVGLFSLKRCNDGTLERSATPLVKQLRAAVEQGEARIGQLEHVAIPSHEAEEEQLPPVCQLIQPVTDVDGLATLLRNYKLDEGRDKTAPLSPPIAEALLAVEPAPAPMAQAAVAQATVNQATVEKTRRRRPAGHRSR